MGSILASSLLPLVVSSLSDVRVGVATTEGASVMRVVGSSNGTVLVSMEVLHGVLVLMTVELGVLGADVLDARVLVTLALGVAGMTTLVVLGVTTLVVFRVATPVLVGAAALRTGTIVSSGRSIVGSVALVSLGAVVRLVLVTVVGVTLSGSVNFSSGINLSGGLEGSGLGHSEEDQRGGE